MKKQTLFLILILYSLAGKAQDFSFSQFYEMPLLRNPALAGVFDGDVRVSGIFRNQWQSVTVPYQTGAASAEVKFLILKKIWITTGLQTTYDQAGDIKLKRTAIMPVINGLIPIGEQTFLAVGGMLGPVNNQFDPTLAKFGDQWVNGGYNPANPTAQTFSRTGMNYWDGSAGVALNGNVNETFHYYAGAGLYHIRTPAVAFREADNKTLLDQKLAITTGVKIETTDINTFEIYADYYIQGGHRQFLGGALYGTILDQVTDSDRKPTLYLGGFYRYNDALIPVVKLDYYQFGFGLSYDVNVSKLSTASNWRGGFELSLNYKAKLRNRSYYLNQTVCPGKGF